jgi:hypothetical protein
MRAFAQIGLDSTKNPLFLEMLTFYCEPPSNDDDFFAEKKPDKKPNLPKADAVLDYFPRNIQLHRLATMAFNRIYLSSPPGHSLPTLNVSSTLLSKEAIFMLDSAIPADQRAVTKKWTNLFNLKTHGQSWTVFHDAILQKGSVVIIFKEKAGKCSLSNRLRSRLFRQRLWGVYKYSAGAFIRLYWNAVVLPFLPVSSNARLPCYKHQRPLPIFQLEYKVSTEWPRIRWSV